MVASRSAIRAKAAAAALSSRLLARRIEYYAEPCAHVRFVESEARQRRFGVDRAGVARAAANDGQD